MEWMILPFKRYADFGGRSRRKEYWMYQLFTGLVYLILFCLMLAGLPWCELGDGSLEQNPNALFTPVFWLGFGLIMVWYVVTFIPDIAVTVRRFHDQDLSGWLYLIRFVPYIGVLIVFVFMVIDGRRGENKYGLDAKAEGMAQVFQ
jgi:uncharacterized membrane protein YhaH (DUF805 family)